MTADIDLSDILSTTTGHVTNISPSAPATDAKLDLHPSVGAVTSSINFYRDDGIDLLSSIINTELGGMNISSTVSLQLQGLVWPSADGLDGQVLSTDGAGILGWVDPVNVDDKVLDVNIHAGAMGVVDSVPVANLKSVKWIVTIENQALSKVVTFEILAQNKFGVGVDYSVYSRIGDRSVRHKASVAIDGGFMQLSITNEGSHPYGVSAHKIILGG